MSPKELLMGTIWVLTVCVAFRVSGWSTLGAREFWGGVGAGVAVSWMMLSLLS